MRPLVVTILGLILGLILSAQNTALADEKDDDKQPDPWELKMSFAEAAQPYEAKHLVYNTAGFVDSEGRVVLSHKATQKQRDLGVGLGCNSYANVVLHRMRYGKDWLQYWNAEVELPDGTRHRRRTLHTEWGDVIPNALGMQSTGQINATKLLNPETMRDLLTTGKSKAGFYYFDVRAKDNRGNLRGHVGFIRINKNGSIIQSHFSGLSSYKGLATGSLSNWLRNSNYKKADFELYFIPS